nr:putative transposase (putative), gypsy type [Tanacetum cinerariifolium]
MGCIDDIKSILTQSALDALCEKFHIPRTIHLELPGRNSRICNSPTSKIGVYTRFFDFANYRIPLSQFLVDVLEYFQINLSQLSVIAAAKISHFEILCRMDLFAFIQHADPTKMRIGEREVGEGEIEESGHAVQAEGANIVCIEDKVPDTIAERAKGSRKKMKTARGASGSNLPPKKLRADHGTFDFVANTGGKFVTVLQSLLECSTLPVEVGVTAVAKLPFITSSVSLTPEREGVAVQTLLLGPIYGLYKNLGRNQGRGSGVEGQVSGHP